MLIAFDGNNPVQQEEKERIIPERSARACFCGSSDLLCCAVQCCAVERIGEAATSMFRVGKGRRTVL